MGFHYPDALANMAPDLYVNPDDGSDFNNLTINKTSASVTVQTDALDVDGTFNVDAGSLYLDSATTAANGITHHAPPGTRIMSGVMKRRSSGGQKAQWPVCSIWWRRSGGMVVST